MLGLLRDAQPGSSRLHSLRNLRRRHLRLEELESRTLLAVFAPGQILHAYGFDQLPYDGTGQTIAIVDAYGNPNVAYDLSIFDGYFGLPDAALTVAQPQGQPFGTNINWALETDLDVQWAHAIAPGANILLVEARTNSITNLMAAVDYARQQPGVVAVSMSWGSYEFPAETQYDSYFTTPDGHIGGSGLPGGVTFVAASGDRGGVVEWPAVSPNVLGVGGTTLTLDDNNNIVSETGWWQSGGGISLYEPQPDYQGSFQTYGTRTTPDVSYSADIASMYWVYDTMGYSGMLAVYGTSAGSPQWAGLVALVDQGLALNNIGSLDGPTQTLPTLYNLANVSYSTYYNDIVDGYNGYAAGPGYDLVTGLGSPVAAQLVQGLVNSIQSPGGAAPGPDFVGPNPPNKTNLTHQALPPVSPPRLVVGPAPLPGHPGTAQKSPPTMQGSTINQPSALLLALTNAASASGLTIVGIPSPPSLGMRGGTDANSTAPLVPAALAPSSRWSESRIESGGGDNAVLIDDSDNDVPDDRATPPTSDPVPAAAILAPAPLLTHGPGAEANWPQVAAACFAADAPSASAATRPAALSTVAEPLGVLPDPLAVAGALAIALGQWAKPTVESDRGRQRFDGTVRGHSPSFFGAGV